MYELNREIKKEWKKKEVHEGKRKRKFTEWHIHRNIGIKRTKDTQKREKEKERSVSERNKKREKKNDKKWS